MKCATKKFISYKKDYVNNYTTSRQSFRFLFCGHHTKKFGLISNRTLNDAHTPIAWWLLCKESLNIVERWYNCDDNLMNIRAAFYSLSFVSRSDFSSMKMLVRSSLFLLLFGTLMLSAQQAFASTTDGTVDTTNKWAWSENAGWIDFGTTAGAVHVTDTALTGYAYSENAGWISLNCSNTTSCADNSYAVANNAEGTLSGYAWSENAGWINFAPTQGGVTINSSGVFSGYAYSENLGWIVFATDHPVTTDWRPASARTTPTPAPSGGGGGGGSAPPAPQTPEGGYVFFITPNPTTNGFVTLHFVGGQDITRIQISDNPSFSPATYFDYVTSVTWTLQSVGEKTLYARFCNQYARCGETLTSKIIYSPPLPPQENTQPSFIENLLPSIIKKISPPEPKPEVEQPIVREVPPKSLEGDWKLLPNSLVYNFVLAPLPSDIAKLTDKFPELGKVFARLGIAKISDLEKLKNTSINLPVIADKKKVPSEILVAEGGQGLIALGSSIALTSEGEVQQKIKTIAGKPIILSVKPESPAESIKGYLLFKRKPEKTAMEIPMNSLVASALLARAPVAQISSETSTIEQELLVHSFEYTDPDHDGIFTAEISAPVVDGEYEVLTVINYKNKEKGSKELRMITVVDPEGYVYKINNGEETRISNVKVSIFSISNGTASLWDASKYNQDNPQITDTTGKYSFLVPPGTYYITAEAQGYKSYKGDEFEVKEGAGVHSNIEMTENGSWFKALLDWKMGVIVLFGVALLINFINDRRLRKRLSII